MNSLQKFLLGLPLLLLNGCWLFANSGDDDDDFGTESTFVAIDYNDPDARYLPSVPIRENTVDNLFDFSSSTVFSVTPALPAGLSLDPNSGSITGTPESEAPRRSFRVTAEDSGTEVGAATIFIAITDPVPPTALSYATNPAVYVALVSIVPNRPTVTGIVTQFSVSPALPEGLRLNRTSGVISGTPRQSAARQTYQVTASNPFGSVSTDLVLEVLVGTNPHGLHVLDGSEPLISNYIADRFPGDVYQRGVQPLTATGLDAASDRAGRFLFVLLINGDIISHRVDPLSTDLLGGHVVGNVTGGVRLAVDASGSSLLVLASGSLLRFAIDASGDLSGGEIAVAPVQAFHLAVHPTDPFAYVSAGFGGGVQVYSFAGPLTALPGQAPIAGSADHLGLPDGGNMLYVASGATGRVHAFAVNTTAATSDTHLQDLGNPALIPGSQIEGFAVAPDGRSVLVGTAFNGSIVHLQIDASGGLLSPVAFAAGSYITDLVVDGGSRIVYALDLVAREVITLRLTATSLSFLDRSRTRQAPTRMALTQGDSVFSLTEFVFVANQTASTLEVYAFDRSAEILSLSDSVSTGTAPADVLFHKPLGVAYTPDNGAGTISMFSFDESSGTLSPMNPPTVSAGTSPIHVVVDESERFAYALDSAGSIFQYTVDPLTGALTETGLSVPVATGSTRLVLEPTGQFLYALESQSGRVGVYAINFTNGSLTRTGFAGNMSEPSDMVAFPQGRHLYVTDATAGGVVRFDIHPINGSLTPSAVVSTGSRPIALDIMKQGFNLFVADENLQTATILDIDFSNGFASPFPAGVSPIILGGAPTDLVVDNGDLYVFVTINSELPLLTAFKSQPSESLALVHSIGIGFGEHQLAVHGRH